MSKDKGPSSKVSRPDTLLEHLTTNHIRGMAADSLTTAALKRSLTTAHIKPSSFSASNVESAPKPTPPSPGDGNKK